MKARYAVLSLVLLAQLLLAAGLYWRGEPSTSGPARQVLLAGSTGEVDRVLVSDGDSEATLVLDGNDWRLPALERLPADAARVNDMLEKVAAASTGWPVTTTRGSQDRFEVSAEHFQRRVQLYHGDTPLAGFYLGTSPGFRQVHVRGLDQDAVYTAPLNVSDFPADDNDWLDKSLLAAASPRQIEGTNFTLVKNEDDGWAFAAPDRPEPGELPQLDTDSAARLAAALATLRIQAVAEDAPSFDAPDGAGTTLRVTSADGVLQYRFHSADDKYYVRRDDLAPVFSLSQYDYQRIAEVGLEELALAPEPEPAESPAQEQAAVVEEQNPQG
jgi:hypothetical protein